MVRSPLSTQVANAFEQRLPRILGEAFERRDGQMEMARSVAETIEADRVLVVEAETGLGKSLAYLVPLIRHCKNTGARAVVSTYTRNLQSQLVEKDFPLAASAAGVQIEGVPLMGRTNYVCRRGVKKLLDEGGSGAALEEWLRTTLDDATGYLESLPESSIHMDASVKTAISCPRNETVCSGCRLRGDCFMLAARRRALNAQVVMVNHALLFSDEATGGALLGPHDVLVVDEAHHLEDVATQCLTLSFTPRTICGASHSAYSPEYDEIVAYARAMVARESEAAVKRVDELWEAYRDSVRLADDKTGELFAVLGGNIESLAGRPGGKERNGLRNGDAAQLTYQEGSPLFYGAETLVTAVAQGIRRMAASAGSLHAVAEETETLADSGALAALKAIEDVSAETLAEFEFVTAGRADDHVFYAREARDDRGARRSRRTRASLSALSASPIDVGARLGTMLEDKAAAVLTSATLAVEGDFSYFLEQVGLDGSPRTDATRYESPFDMVTQRAVLVAEFLPDPAGGDFVSEAARVIGDCVRTCDRRALVLCTAKRQVPALARRLLEDEPGGELYLQTDGVGRGDLLERFKRSRRGILIGVASFWEGVDLPGDLLELLIILKLPFLVPSDPIVQARARRVEEAGDHPFEKLFLPDVILRLRQGIGRLIRSSGDRGVVLVLDRRLVGSQYGDRVLGAVTKTFVTCRGRDDMVERAKAHLEAEPES